jgi:hypothetical protein
MNTAQIEAIKTAIANLEDNRYRYHLAEQRKPGQVSGNGEKFSAIIADHDRRIAELKQGLEGH